jgi:uncharacterized membrane protein
MATSLQRVWGHLFAPSAQALYPKASLQRIAAAIAQGETRHRGQVCFAVDSALPIGALLADHDARSCAHEAFARLRVWDTAANNGVLIYLLVADHRIEIVADRGLDGRVAPSQWAAVCRKIEQGLRTGEAEAAALTGVEMVSALLAEHFPRTGADEAHNELPDLPHILG